MKELSIEEKAKRYDEAIEQATEWYNDSYIGIGFKANLEKLFPELKESEDERIRKSLLNYLHTLPNHYTHDGVCAPEWIDWLEKQGNLSQKRKRIFKRRCTGKMKECLNNVTKESLESTRKILESEREQECSEEDKEFIDDLIGFFDCQQQHLAHSDEEMLAWLKSIRPQNTWKPSDNQIMALRWVLNHIPYDSHKEEISGLLEQLKKLKA